MHKLANGLGASAAALTALAIFVLDPAYDNFSILLIGCMLVLGFGFSVISWSSATGRGLDLYVLFLFAAYLFHGSAPVVFLFDTQTPLFDAEFGNQELGRIFVLTLACLIAMHAGALAAVSNGYSSDQILPVHMVSLGVALIALSIIPVLYTHYVNMSVVSALGYEGLYQQPRTTTSGIVDVLAGFFIPGCMLLLGGLPRNRFARRVACSLVLMNALPKFFYGSRFLPSMEIAALILMYDALVKRIPRSPAVVFSCIALLVVFPTISVIRNVPASERLDVAAYVQAFQNLNNPVLSIFTEMGGSAETIGWTLERVPSQRPFDWGASYLSALRTIVPNLGEGKHVAVERSLASWLTREVDPEFDARGGSVGFSFIAEAYLNFGPVGAVLFLGALGVLLSFLVSWAYSGREPARLVVVATLCSSMLIFVRGEFLYQSRMIAWYAFLPYCTLRALSYLSLRDRLAPRQSRQSIGRLEGCLPRWQLNERNQ